MKKKWKNFVILAVILILISILSILGNIYLSKNQAEMEEGFHIHADFAVYLNGEFYNFSKKEFMSDEHSHNHGYVHLHDNDGEIIHYHLPEISLEIFFESIGMSFNESCFVTEIGEKFCDGEEGSLYFLVNGESRAEFGSYIAKDLDRILIAHGNFNEEELRELMESVSDRACIPSGKCLDRGLPSSSSCGAGACIIPLG